mmetsp:Transcript_8784/g.20316  ORF Transcript_8784/g.20316 Transcript_8784/m.20316 type:complete len:97 (-) Transcript_8784:49-339(-)
MHARATKMPPTPTPTAHLDQRRVLPFAADLKESVPPGAPSRPPGDDATLSTNIPSNLASSLSYSPIVFSRFGDLYNNRSTTPNVDLTMFFFFLRVV